MEQCRTRLFTDTTQTGYEFFTHTVTINNTGNDYHDHDYIEIVLVLDGTMFAEINERPYKIPPNTIIFLRPQDRHAYLDDSKERHRDMCYTCELFKEICDFLSPHLYHSYMTAPDPAIIPLSEITVSEIENMAQKTSFSVEIKLSDSLIKIKTLCVKLLDLLLNEQTSLNTNKRFPEILNELLFALELNSNMENKSLDEILSEFHYNKAYMRRLFKQYLNVGLQQYWLAKKLTRAATLLKISNLSVKEISQQCGFNSYAYFNNTFTERFKMTPYKYKQKK